MRILVATIWFWVFLMGSISAQREMRVMDGKTATLTNQGEKTIVRLTDKSPKKLKTDCLYYWFIPGRIMSTQGGFDGRLLDGMYTVTFPDKQLKAQGMFDRGLKKGRWVEWYSNGRIKEVTHWRRGVLHGEYKSYSELGVLLEEGKYVNGKLKKRKEETPKRKAEKTTKPEEKKQQQQQKEKKAKAKKDQP